MNWEGVLEGSGFGLILRYYSGIHLERLRRNTKNLSVAIAGFCAEISTQDPRNAKSEC
jgi:hypothetical protein